MGLRKAMKTWTDSFTTIDINESLNLLCKVETGRKVVRCFAASYLALDNSLIRILSCMIYMNNIHEYLYISIADFNFTLEIGIIFPKRSVIFTISKITQTQFPSTISSFRSWKQGRDILLHLDQVCSVYSKYFHLPQE